MKDREKHSELDEVEQEASAYPRRKFLQKFALLTGAFVMGVLRIDKAFGFKNPCKSDREDPQEAPYCCGMMHPDGHNPDCDITKELKCTSKFYWICDWCDRKTKTPYMIRCLECFNIPIEANQGETFQCYYEARNYEDNLICSKAIHPDDNDYRIPV